MNPQMAQLALALAKRQKFPKKDAFLDMAFKLAKLAAEESCIFTVLLGENIGTFSKDNYGSLPLFFLEAFPQKNEAVVIARKFEDGPKEARSQLPYKSLGAMVYKNQEWKMLSEEFAKAAHITDAETGEVLEVETAVLFSTIPEMFPNLSD
jgi:hypothetical protein